MENFYRRNLPHWQPEEAEYFITFRLTGSLPSEIIKQLRSKQKNLEDSDSKPSEIQRRIFARYEKLLDGSSTGPIWLRNKQVAKTVREALHYRDQNEYDLYAFCIMPNHVHLVFKLLSENKSKYTDNYPVTKMLHELKRYTAVRCNKILDRKGQFWQHESFDRVIRDKRELENTIRYVLQNPVKSGLAKYWEDWPYTYCKPEFAETFKQNM